MNDIAIIGAGISGTTLALSLQARGIGCTIYTDRTASDLRRQRLPNTVVRYGPTVVRERELGIDHWRGLEERPQRISFSVTGTPIAFSGPLPGGGSAVDFRLYLPRILDDFVGRGGHVAGDPPTTFAGLSMLARRHALVVLACGPGDLAEWLPRDPERSPREEPQRALCAGLWHGIDQADPPAITYAVAPGAGEIFQFPMFSRHRRVSAVLIEAVPGGPLMPAADRSCAADRSRFEAMVLDLVERHAPGLAERITPSAFHLIGERDLFQGSVTPVVRRTWRAVEPGRYVIGLGDGWVANDPITGQGANLGSACAAALADLVAAHRDAAFDEDFCREADRRLWALAEPVCRFTDAMLEPPAPHVLDVLRAATGDQAVADAFAANFADPPAMWAALADRDSATAFVASTRSNPPNEGSSRERTRATVDS